MSIDKTRKFWHGDCPEDIIEYLDGYSENQIGKTVLVKCDQCGNDAFTFQVDPDEGAIEVVCASCGKKRLLLDSSKYWDDCSPTKAKCPECKKNQYNLGIGFVYRENGDVKWIYIGNRCTNCGLLGSYADWKINYGPTNEMERNI